MWYLTSENDNRVMYIVSSANQIVIGRSIDNQVCNFAIPDDASISRKHATLAITNNSLYLQDLGSRYGTFINANIVEANSTIKLNQDDVVKFGKMNSTWKVHVKNFTTCTSTLKGENLQNLKLTISQIGGMLKSDWDDTCNYLTMPAITLTIKVVLALVQGSDIVTVDFWNKCFESVTNWKVLPDPHNFLPQVVESTLNKEVVSFRPDSRRKALFEGKKFIFFSRRQYEMYKTVLIKGCASPMLLSECRMTISMLCAPEVIVIQYIASGASQETQSQKKTITEIVNQLKNKGKRVVADAEIGLAILYCSMDKYCNPNFSFTSEVIKQTTAPVKNSKVLAQESQEPMSQQQQRNVHIDESLMSQENNDRSSIKRKLSEFTGEVQADPNKKFVSTKLHATDIKIENIKRRLSETDDVISNPTKRLAVDLNEDSNDMFNFVQPAPTNSGTESKVKKLNLTKPQKRKFNDSNDDDLFNFVQNSDNVKAEDNDTPKQNIFNINKKKKEDSDNTEETHDKKTEEVSAKDIVAMRGSKLTELMANNTLKSNSNSFNILKKEKTEELEKQMNKLDISNTVVTTCNNLIVKREPFITETENSLIKNTSTKNFKTFKKVWPVKRQITIIHTSSTSFGDSTAA